MAKTTNFRTNPTLFVLACLEDYERPTIVGPNVANIGKKLVLNLAGCSFERIKLATQFFQDYMIPRHDFELDFWPPTIKTKHKDNVIYPSKIEQNSVAPALCRVRKRMKRSF